MKILRHYQLSSVDAFSAQFRSGKRRGILCAPTGSGKTATAMEMVRRCLENGRKALFLADRNILVEQFLQEAIEWGLHPGLIRRNSFTDLERPFQIASKDTFLSRVLQRKKIPLPPADLVILDEAHRSLSFSFKHVTDQYPNSWICGLTATPVRPKGNGLGPHFDFLVETAKISQLLQEGFLVPSICFAPTFPDLSKCKKGPDGDYLKADLLKVMTRDNMVGDVVNWWKKLAENRPTLCYGVSIAHSLWMRDEFLKAGIRACHLDGKSSDEELKDAFAEFKAGKLQILTCADLMTEGVDLPLCSCIQIVRPTKSLRLARQMYGRAMRPYPGKDNFIVIDHAGVVLLHGLPEEDQEWTLDPDGKTIDEKRQEKLLDGNISMPLVCSKCYTVYAGLPACPNCGEKPGRRRKKVGGKAGTLIRVDKSLPGDRQPLSLQREWTTCLAIAANKNGTWGMANAIFKARTALVAWEAGVEPMPEGGMWKRLVSEDLPQFVRKKKVEV